MIRKRFGAALVLALAALALVATAGATYAGRNGDVAFGMSADGNTDIYAAPPDGTALTRLTTDPSFDACPAYSADGRQIAFCSDRSGSLEIWAMNADGSNQHQITNAGGSFVFPDWSADGRKIVFSGQLPADFNGRDVRSRGRGSEQVPTDDIFVANADGSGLRQLTHAAGDDDYPAFSPDGSKIVFISYRTGTGQVWLMNADGSNQHPLTTSPGDKDQVPDWSPDGKRIAFHWNDDIWVMNADGTNAHDLTNTDDREFGAAWSPDGTRIAYVRVPADGPRSVWVMDANGSNQHPLEPSGRQSVPAWQPLP